VPNKRGRKHHSFGRRMKRRGISTVMSTAVLVVLSITAALLLYGPTRSFIINAFRRTGTVGGSTELEIIHFSPTDGIIRVKNIGPSPLINANETSNWQVIINDQYYEVSSVAGCDSGVLGVNAVAKLTVSGSIPQEHTYTIIVYGPERTVAQTTWGG